MSVKITTNINYEQLKMPAPSDLLPNIEEYLNKATLQMTAANFRMIGNMARSYEKELRVFQTWLQRQDAIFKGLSKEDKKSAEKIRQLSYDKNIFRWEQLLKEVYAFIQKTRSLFTKERLEYLILFDESLSGDKSSPSRIAEISLRQLLPTVSLALEEGEARLRINRTEELRKIYYSLQTISDSSQDIENVILNNFSEILRVRALNYQNKRNELRQKGVSEEQIKEELTGFFTSRGFAFEEAVTLANKGGDLIDSYIQDTEAFWRGGDLKSALGEIPKQLLKNRTDLNFELKRVSATAQKTIGANLASLQGLITAVTTIANILLHSELSEAEMEKVLNHFLFKAQKNISNKFAESIGKISAETLKQIMSNNSKWSV